MRHFLVALLLASAALAPVACNRVREPKTVLDLKDVPPNILEIAKTNLPGVTFDSAWRKANGSFEIRGKAKNGKVREIDIRPDGSIEEIE